jgi:hypothetical protein
MSRMLGQNTNQTPKPLVSKIVVILIEEKIKKIHKTQKIRELKFSVF